MVEEQQTQAVGQACQQQDGSWQVTLNTPGLPQQVYTLPPQAIQLYPYPEPYYWWGPWFYGPPFAGGPVIFANRFYNHRFHNGGFRGSYRGRK